MFFYIICHIVLIGGLFQAATCAPLSSNSTADTDFLKTWWHSTGKVNTNTTVADGDVRMSHKYAVQVSTKANVTSCGNGTLYSNGMYYDSFVYETIPRSGKGKLCYPDKPDICDDDDQISIEPDIGVTMAWSQFLYQSDAIVKITRLDEDGKNISAADITIRPTNRTFDYTTSGASVFITVPYTPDTNGARFSVEFADDIFEYHTQELAAQSNYVQDVNKTGEDYVESYTDEMPIVGREPLNALLIFASPFPSDNMVPSDQEDEDIYEVQPGLVESLSDVNKSIVSFGPGIYWFTGSNRAVLSSSVSWVYIAPGAYVKGAIEYNNNVSTLLKATGFGVLSGEQYVYQANTADGYSNNKSDTTSLKMWQGNGVTANQTWILNGITTNAPPFNIMDFYGETDIPGGGFSIDVSDYKQVGSFYGQTDGLEIYTNGRIRDIFYHTGDDTIKTYYSDTLIERVIVWKTNNAPIIQMGWCPRTLNNILVDQLDIIHSRYYSVLDYAPRAIIGSSASYVNEDSLNTANISTTISNFTVSNIRSEGLSPGLISLNMLSNVEDFHVNGAWIEEFSPVPTLNTSSIVGFTDAHHNQKVALGSPSNSTTNGIGLTISDYKVGNKTIVYEKGNWNLNVATQSTTVPIDVDSAYTGRWVIQ